MEKQNDTNKANSRITIAPSTVLEKNKYKKLPINVRAIL